MIPHLRHVLPPTPAAGRAAWVFERLLSTAAGGDPPNDDEIAEQYAPMWLAEVPTGPKVFSELAPIIGTTRKIRAERSRANEARIVLELADGTLRRFRCMVEEGAPHRISFQIFCPALGDPAFVDVVVERDGRSVHARDYGGEGPLLLLWHGAGCDATVWEGVIPHLRSFRVLAQDLPGHGASALPRLSVDDAVADGAALLDELGLGRPILVGHSLGGWVALHFAAGCGRCRGLVCLDGPTALDFAAMGLLPDHPGFVPDPPNVVTDLDALRCPALIALCAGSSPAEGEWMVPFRRGLSDHVTGRHGPAEVEWLATGHAMVLTHPEQTAELIREFALRVAVG